MLFKQPTMFLRGMFFVIVLCSFKFVQNTFYEDYCWRDYDGEIPSDAIVGGVDSQSRPIYIGQAVYDFKLVPGKIYMEDKNCYINYNEEHAINDSVQILCSQRPDKFEWLRVSYNQIKDLRSKRVVEGGYEKGFKTYIGRVLAGSEITVSKVTCWANGCEKLAAMTNGVMEQYETFDILVYNLDTNEKE